MSEQQKRTLTSVVDTAMGGSWLLPFLVAMVGHTIHGSTFWAVMDALFWPFAIAKWLVFHEVSRSVIERTFSFVLQ